MTVQTSSNKSIALGNGSQTQFAFGFIGVAAAYIGVIYTDASGNETILSQGAGATQYQIALNAAVNGALWGVGGTVTYDPSSTPIASGTSLTIFRTLPLTQAISLQNLVSLATLGNGAETGLDTIEMQLQQVSELFGRAIVAPIVDPSTINLTLPAAAQRANSGLAFDAFGNVIAGTTPATGLISSAMQPVVDAASLAAGRAAFGLGAAALEGIGAGLQDDGSGNLRVWNDLVAVATNQVVDKTFHTNQYIATGPINFTLDQTTTLFNGFGFSIFAFAGIITLVPNAADSIDQAPSGNTLAIPKGTAAFVTTDGAGNWYVESSNVGASQRPALGEAQLRFVSSSQVGLFPFKGQRVTFPGGTVAVLPSAGVLASPTSCYLNGVAASALSAATLYYVYLFNTGSDANPNYVLNFSATGHSTDAGSGIEIMTGNAAQVLVGMVYPTTGPVFQDGATARLVATWFNRRPRQMSNSLASNTGSTSTAFVELTTAMRCLLLSWGDALSCMLSMNTANATASQLNTTAIVMDGTVVVSTTNTLTGTSTTAYFGAGSAGVALPTEGFHYITMFIQIAAGNGAWFGSVNDALTGIVVA